MDFASSPGFQPRRAACALCKLEAPYTGTALCDDCLDLYEAGALHARGLPRAHTERPGAPAPPRAAADMTRAEVRAMAAVAPADDPDALFSLRMLLYREARALAARAPVRYMRPYRPVGYASPLDCAQPISASACGATSESRANFL